MVTGQQYSMTAKAYFEHPPLFIEFALVPELEAYHKSETKIEVATKTAGEDKKQEFINVAGSLEFGDD